MREKMITAVAEIGYRPDMLAQSLAARGAIYIGFSASHIANPVLAQTVTGTRTVAARGLSMLVTDAEGDPGSTSRTSTC